MASAKTPIVYGVVQINGIPVRPISRDIISKAIDGHPIEIAHLHDYINLYHVFDRWQERDPKLRGFTLVRKQTGPSRWLLFVAKRRDDVPEVEFAPGYDPKSGRYKRYAEQLASGNALTFDGRAEAAKAQRAWHLYVPRAKRKHLTSTVRKIARTGKYLVTICDRL